MRILGIRVLVGQGRIDLGPHLGSGIGKGVDGGLGTVLPQLLNIDHGCGVGNIGVGNLTKHLAPVIHDHPASADRAGHGRPVIGEIHELGPIGGGNNIAAVVHGMGSIHDFGVSIASVQLELASPVDDLGTV